MTHPASSANPAVVPVVQYGYRDDDDDESEDESSRGRGFLGGIIHRPQTQRKDSARGLTGFLNESASRFNGGKANIKNDADDGNDSDDSGGSKASVAEKAKQKAKQTLKNLGKGLRFGRKKHENEEESSSSEDEANGGGEKEKEENSSDEEEEMNRSVSSIASQTLKRVTGKVSNVLGLGRRKGEEESDDDDDEKIIAPNNHRRGSEKKSHEPRRGSERQTHESPIAAPFRRARTATDPNASKPHQRGGMFRASTGSSGTPRRTHTSDNLPRRSPPPAPTKSSPRKAKSGSPGRDRYGDKVIPKEAAFAMTREIGSSGFLKTKDDIMEDESDRYQNNALFNPSAQYGKQPTPSVPDWSMNVTEELWEQAMSDVEDDGNKKWKMNVPKKLLKDKI